MTSPRFIAALTRPKPLCLCIAGETWRENPERPRRAEGRFGGRGGGGARLIFSASSPRLAARRQRSNFRLETTGGLFIQYFTSRLPSTLSSAASRSRREEPIVQSITKKTKKLKLKITSDRSSGYFFRTSSLQPQPARHATGGLTGV